jgi:hypothetical protein
VLVSSDDLELADLDKSIPRLTNAHFQKTVSAGALTFDYTLRPGPARRRIRSASWNWQDCRFKNRRPSEETPGIGWPHALRFTD